jgi:hypothetical protein
LDRDERAKLPELLTRKQISSQLLAQPADANQLSE